MYKNCKIWILQISDQAVQIQVYQALCSFKEMAETSNTVYSIVKLYSTTDKDSLVYNKSIEL